MRTPAYFEYVAGCIGGSAQPNASAQILAGAQTVVPTRDIARMFTDFVTAPDCRIATNNEVSRTLAALRDALLPKLICGEIRVTKDTLKELKLVPDETRDLLAKQMERNS